MPTGNRNILWNSRRRWLTRYRLTLITSIVLIGPLGYVVRFSQIGPAWMHDVLGSIAYEIFWILLVVVLLPVSPFWAAIGVFLATCGLEVLQLWQHPTLQAMRSTLVGRMVLGNSFTGSDFPVYAVGSLLGWLWVRSLQLLFQSSSNP